MEINEEIQKLKSENEYLKSKANELEQSTVQQTVSKEDVRKLLKNPQDIIKYGVSILILIVMVVWLFNTGII